MSRLNASAPGGRKKGSFLPHTLTEESASTGNTPGISDRVDVAGVVEKQVKLNFVVSWTAKKCGVELVVSGATRVSSWTP